jgi:hypothetical protein
MNLAWEQARKEHLTQELQLCCQIYGLIFTPIMYILLYILYYSNLNPGNYFKKSSKGKIINIIKLRYIKQN